MVQSWMFTEETEDLAALAHHMAVVAEKHEPGAYKDILLDVAIQI